MRASHSYFHLIYALKAEFLCSTGLSPRRIGALVDTSYTFSDRTYNHTDVSLSKQFCSNRG